jgi:hypothetical protein
MDEGVVEKEYPCRGRAHLLVLFIVWGGTLAILVWAATDHSPFRGRDGRVTVSERSASLFRWSVFGLCSVFAVYASRWFGSNECMVAVSLRPGSKMPTGGSAATIHGATDGPWTQILLDFQSEYVKLPFPIG